MQNAIDPFYKISLMKGVTKKVRITIHYGICSFE